MCCFAVHPGTCAELLCLTPSVRALRILCDPCDSLPQNSINLQHAGLPQSTVTIQFQFPLTAHLLTLLSSHDQVHTLPAPACSVQSDNHESVAIRGRNELQGLVEHFRVTPSGEMLEASHRLYKLALQRGFTRGRRVNQVCGFLLSVDWKWVQEFVLHDVLQTAWDCIQESSWPAAILVRKVFQI